MTIFSYTDYKAYVRDRIRSLPKGGYGEYRRIAIALSMHATTVCQVFRKHKNLTFDQAVKLSTLWKMTEYETDYFLTLVEWERADSEPLRRALNARLDRLRVMAGHAAPTEAAVTPSVFAQPAYGVP